MFFSKNYYIIFSRYFPKIGGVANEKIIHWKRTQKLCIDLHCGCFRFGSRYTMELYGRYVAPAVSTSTICR